MLVGTWNLEFSMEIVLIVYRFKKTRPQELKSLAHVGVLESVGFAFM